MNGWVFLCKEGFSEDRGIRPQTLVYEAHLQGDARVPRCLPRIPHSLSSTLQIEARTLRGGPHLPSRFLGVPHFVPRPQNKSSALCLAP